MYERIVVPLDGSHFAEAALPHALELSRKFAGKLILVQVVIPPDVIPEDVMGGGELVVRLEKIRLNEAEAYLQRKGGELRQQGFEVALEARLSGDIAGGIIDVAEAHNADMIVMSTHGRTGLSRWLFGSVAQKVLQHAPVHTLLIRAKELV